MFALASRRQRAIASPTESGTWLPPGASRKAKPLCNELKRRRTAVGSSVSAAIGLLFPERAAPTAVRASGARARCRIGRHGHSDWLCWASKRSTSVARARHSSGSWCCAMSLASTATGVPWVPLVSSPRLRTTVV